MSSSNPVAIQAIIGNVISQLADETKASQDKPKVEAGSSVYDYDLSEFPLFFFHTHRIGNRNNSPILYSDSITGPNGETVERQWQVHPGSIGFGGPSTQVTLFDLIQIYFEQGGQGSQIHFGTVRSFLQRRGSRNPSKRDYQRIRRDIDILRGYDFHCKNAFYDKRRKRYADLNWRLFGSVFYFKAMPEFDADEAPVGFLEVSPIFQRIIRERGFFALGFGKDLFHSLKPLEQRLALFLSKKFMSQSWHKRFETDLAKILPVIASRSVDVRSAIDRASRGLIEKGFPLMEAFAWEKNRDGKWLAVFTRRELPREEFQTYRQAALSLSPAIAFQVQRIVEAVGRDDDRRWWAQCVQRLGEGAVDRALGQLREARVISKVRSPGAMLTKIFKDIARDAKIALN